MKYRATLVAVALGLTAVLISQVAAQSIRRGDLVLVKDGQRRLAVKIVLAVPGETVSISQGQIMVNGASLADLPRDSAPPLEWVPRRLDDGNYFVFGDPFKLNPDPRAWGIVEIDSIIGMVHPAGR